MLLARPCLANSGRNAPAPAAGTSSEELFRKLRRLDVDRPPPLD
jgi:hypothetical protein